MVTVGGLLTSVRNRLYIDLSLIVLITAGVLVAHFVSGIVDPFVRIALGLAFVLFAPGYALVSLLLPADTASGSSLEPLERYGGDEPLDVTGTERIVLSIGLSVILVPLVGIVLHYTSWGIQPGSVLLVTGTTTIVLSVIAVERRARVSASRRFDGSPLVASRWLREWVTVPGRRRETALNVILVVGLVIAAAGIGLAVATSENGERYTELYLLSEDPETGEAIADGYPAELSPGDEAELQVGISNQERETVTYTVVVQLERIEDPNDEPSVEEREELDRFETTLEHDEIEEIDHSIEPTMEGENLRVSYLLFVDSPPEGTPVQSSADAAYRTVHFWIDVGDSNGDDDDL